MTLSTTASTSTSSKALPLGWLWLPAGGLPAMGLTIMDPTDESEAIERSLAARDASLDNATIALIDM